MQREAATPLIEHALNYLCELASLRLHKLEPRHPLRLRTKKACNSLHPTCLEKLAQLCPATTWYSNPLLDLCPWEEHLGESHKRLAATGGTEDKKKVAANFNLWLASLDKNDIVAYTNGSQKWDRTGKILGTGLDWIRGGKKDGWGWMDFCWGLRQKCMMPRF